MAVYQKRNGKAVKLDIGSSNNSGGNIQIPVNPETDAFVSLPDIPILTVSAGLEASFITNATSTLEYSLPIREFTLTTLSPYTRRVFQADANGTASIKFPVPDNQSSIIIQLQAIDIAGNTSKINTRRLSITYGDYIKAPIILSPLNNTNTNDSLEIIVNEDIGTEKDSLASTDFKICSDINGINVVEEALNVENAYSYTFNDLSLNLEDGKNYWIFVRFKGYALGYSKWSVPVTIQFTTKQTTKNGRVIYRHSSGKGTVLEYNDGLFHKIFIANVEYWKQNKFGYYGVDFSSEIFYPYNYTNLVANVIGTAILQGGSNYLYDNSVFTEKDFATLWPYLIFGNISSEEACDRIIAFKGLEYKDSANTIGLPAIKHCRTIEVDGKKCSLPILPVLANIAMELKSILEIDPTSTNTNNYDLVSCTQSTSNYIYHIVSSTNISTINSTGTKSSTFFSIPIIELETSVPEPVIAPSGRKYYRHPSNKGTVMEFNDGVDRKVVILDARYRSAGVLINSDTSTLEKMEGLALHTYDVPNKNNNWFLNGISNSSVADCSLLTDEQLNNIWKNSIDENTGIENTKILSAISDTLTNSAKALLDDTTFSGNNIACNLPNFNTLLRIFCDAEVIDGMDVSVGTSSSTLGNICSKGLGGRNPNGEWTIGIGDYKNFITSSTISSNGQLRVISSDGDCTPVSAINSFGVIPVLEIWPKEIETPKILTSFAIIGTQGSYIEYSSFTVLKGAYDIFLSIEYKVCTDAQGNEIIDSGEIEPNTHYLNELHDIIVGNEYYLFIRFKAKEHGFTSWSEPLKVMAKRGYTSKFGRNAYRHESGKGTVLCFNDGQDRKILVLDGSYREAKAMVLVSKTPLLPSYTGTSGYINNTNYTDEYFNTSNDTIINSFLRNVFSSSMESRGWLNSHTIVNYPALEFCRQHVIDGHPCYLPNNNAMVRILAESEILNMLDPNGNCIVQNETYFTSSRNSSGTSNYYTYMSTTFSLIRIAYHTSTNNTCTIIPILEIDEPGSSKEHPFISGGRKIYRHTDGMSIVMEYSGNTLLIPYSIYRETKYFGTYGTDVSELINFSSIKNIKYNSYINGTSSMTKVQANINDVHESTLNTIWSNISDNPSSKELDDIWLTYKDKTDTSSIKTVGVPSVEFARNCIVPGYGCCDVPNLNILIRLFLESYHIDSCDPTYFIQSTTGMNSIYPASSNEYSNVAISTINSSGTVASLAKNSNTCVVPILDTSDYTPSIIINTTGRRVYRHESGIGSIVELNDSISNRKVLVLDAKYRFTSVFSSSSDGEGSNLAIPELITYSNYQNTASNMYLNGKSAVMNYMYNTYRVPDIPDSQINSLWSSIIDANTSNENTDIWMEYEDTVAIHKVREISLPDTWKASIPNINTLIRIFLESTTIDGLDPTVGDYPIMSLLSYFNHVYKAVSSTMCLPTAMLSVAFDGTISIAYKSSISGIIPIVELESVS